MKKLKLCYFLIILSVVTGCSLESMEDSSAEQELLTQFEVEEAFKGSSYVTEVYYAGQKLPVSFHNGNYIYQGDILLSPDLITTEPVKIYEKGDTPPSNKSAGRPSMRWPDNTVYYEISDILEDKHRVINAIQHWEANTHLTFKERRYEQNYIYFQKGEGCSSFIGMKGGRQEITLEISCSTGSTIHEIGHAIGLWHEQSRADRDNYIRINYENIEEGKEHNFHTYQQEGLEGIDLTEGLDFSSIMMYGSYSFSKNGEPTIVKKDGSLYEVQRTGLSDDDILGINKLYPSAGGANWGQLYENGKYYTIKGILVYRMHDKWYFYSSAGWREIELQQDHWFYV